MEKTFKCGLVKVCSGREEPNWSEFAHRMGFVQKLGLNVVFQNSFQDEQKQWLVPFFVVEEAMGCFVKAEQAIEETTPYEIVGIRRIDVAHADIETLRLLTALMERPVPLVRRADVEPEPAHHALAKPQDAFEGLIGMQAQKELVTQLAEVKAKYGSGTIDCFHFTFVGPPGTGKTELASRMPACLDALGITDGHGSFHKVGEADLVAKFVGHTAPKVQQVIEASLGGVLFIDEAYALANAPYFGREAVDTLVDQLDVHRHDFVCIIAGYPDEIDALLDLNPGLRDRFGFRVEFSGYTDAELADIFCTMAKGRGFETSDLDVLQSCVAKLRGSKGFSNARTMRKLLDHTIMEAASTHGTRTIGGRDLTRATERVCVRAPGRRVGF